VARGIFIGAGGYSPGGLGDGIPPLGSKGEALVESLGFLQQKRLKIENFANSPPDSWPVRFTMGELSNILGT